jgi:E3 ubiquitin-protein ligase RNF139
LAQHAAMTAKHLLSRGAETLIAVLGMTSVVSSLCHYVGSFFHFILTMDGAGAGDDDEKSVASVSAVIFFILAMQTGLTGLDPEKRFARLTKNLCLLLTALFHFIHNMVRSLCLPRTRFVTWLIRVPGVRVPLVCLGDLL